MARSSLSLVGAAITIIREKQKKSKKPLAIVLAGHNGSGKSTFWYKKLVNSLQIPLINADRMMMSVLPEPKNGRLVPWALRLRDSDPGWMRVAQGGVLAFVETAKQHHVLFAMETVFSYWNEKPDGTVESKIDTITGLQKAGYFVVLIFVGLSSVELSIGRVMTRKLEGGHDVPVAKLRDRFPRTQKAIRQAIPVADAALLVDNSRSLQAAFTLCLVRLKKQVLYDIRRFGTRVPSEISAWLSVVAP